MRNREVSDDFANGLAETKTKNVFIEGRAIYSYGHHFPMAFKLDNSECLFNVDKYSSSTSAHQSATSYALTSRGYKLIFVSTAQIKEAIDRDVKSVKEMMISNI